MRYFLLLTSLLLFASCKGPVPISSIDEVNPPGLTHELNKHSNTGSLTRGLDAPALRREDEQIDDVLNRLHSALINIVREIEHYDTLSINTPWEYHTFSTGQIDYSGYFFHQVKVGNYPNSSADLVCSLNDYSPDDSLFLGGGLFAEFYFYHSQYSDNGNSYGANFSGVLDMGGLYSGKVTLDELRVSYASGWVYMVGKLLLDSDNLGVTLSVSGKCRSCPKNWVILAED